MLRTLKMTIPFAGLIEIEDGAAEEEFLKRVNNSAADSEEAWLLGELFTGHDQWRLTQWGNLRNTRSRYDNEYF